MNMYYLLKSVALDMGVDPQTHQYRRIGEIQKPQGNSMLLASNRTTALYLYNVW
jgi:hypothetical protein